MVFEMLNLKTSYESQHAFQHYFLEIYPDAKIIFEELIIAYLKRLSYM